MVVHTCRYNTVDNTVLFSLLVASLRSLKKRSRLWALAIFIVRKVYLGAYPGVGAFRSSSQIGYLGAYPGVGACPGDYGSYCLKLTW